MIFELLWCRRRGLFSRLFLLLSSNFAVLRVVFQPGHVFLRSSHELRAAILDHSFASLNLSRTNKEPSAS